MVQPDASGDIPSGPVSWYGVARPFAVSGRAGTMMSQLTLAAAAAAAGALAEALAEAGALGHGAADAEAAAAGAEAAVAGAEAAVAGAEAAVAGAEAAAADPGAAPAGLADAVAQSPRADWAMCVVLLPETVRMIPRVRPRAIGMASGTAMRAARDRPTRRRHD